MTHTIGFRAAAGVAAAGVLEPRLDNEFEDELERLRARTHNMQISPLHTKGVRSCFRLCALARLVLLKQILYRRVSFHFVCI